VDAQRNAQFKELQEATRPPGWWDSNWGGQKVPSMGRRWA